MCTMYTATQLVCSETVQIYLHLLHHNLNGLHTEIQIIFGIVYTSVQCLYTVYEYRPAAATCTGRMRWRGTSWSGPGAPGQLTSQPGGPGIPPSWSGGRPWVGGRRCPPPRGTGSCPARWWRRLPVHEDGKCCRPVRQIVLEQNCPSVKKSGKLCAEIFALPLVREFRWEWWNLWRHLAGGYRNPKYTAML